MANKIAVYGGAFDPVTKAHEGIAKAVFDHTGMDVWMMPCYGHLFNKELAAPAHRLHMARLAAGRNEFLTACDFEIVRRHAGSTFETMQALEREYPGRLFHIVIGMDNANCIHRWHRGEELVSTYPCVVIGREGVQPVCEWYLQPPHDFIDFPMRLSATDVRDAIEAKDHDFAKDSLAADVWEYIKENGLYGYEGET